MSDDIFKKEIHMKTVYTGLDVMRGIGIFFVLILHTAFYFYADIYDVDLDNPSLIITLIGFLLMFAGLFAMISGMVHTIQHTRRLETNERIGVSHLLRSGLILLLIAYLYFLVTGPGIIHFDQRMMDESLFVSLINQGRFQPISLDRLLYVDSLVMLSLNMMLLALVFKILGKRLLKPKTAHLILLFAILFMGLSYIRIPLYGTYLSALDDKQYLTVIMLNMFVNKNNPIFPFFAFALFGSWLALMLRHETRQSMVKKGVTVALVFITLGITGYILAPETMLERMIDPTWYFIMVIQIGLFILLILLALRIDSSTKKVSFVTCFFKRFGVAGLTPFFFESVVSALLFLLINSVIRFAPSIPEAILFGLVLAIAWGIFLIFWERHGYRYGIEWLRATYLSRRGHSSKKAILSGDEL